MSNVTIVVIFLFMTFLSLSLVSIVNRRQMRARLISQKITQIKRRVAELEEFAAILDTLVENPEIAQAICEEAIDLIQTMLQLSPESHYLEANMNTAQQLYDQFSDPHRSREIYRLQESDATIARSLYVLNEAGRVLRKRQTKGTIELSQMEAYIQDLSWAHLMVSVVSHVGQGHKAYNKGDVLKAHAFYKKAQQVALQTNNGNEKRHQLVKEISEMMSNKRRYLSHNIMPETDYNPIANDDNPMLPSHMESLPEIDSSQAQ